MVELKPGQLVVGSRGVEHRTGSDDEAEVLRFEPAEVVNTSGFTAPPHVLP